MVVIWRSAVSGSAAMASAGSQIMPGDADLVAGGMLTEHKTTSKKPSLAVTNLRQILGYVFMDYAGEFTITDVGAVRRPVRLPGAVESRSASAAASGTARDGNRDARRVPCHARSTPGRLKPKPVTLTGSSSGVACRKSTACAQEEARSGNAACRVCEAPGMIRRAGWVALACGNHACAAHHSAEVREAPFEDQAAAGLAAEAFSM